MTTLNLNINEILKRNELLEKENKELKEKVFENFLNKNSTENYYEFRIEELEKENQLLRQKNAYLSLIAH